MGSGLAQSILSVRDLDVAWGGRQALSVDGLELGAGELLGVIGPNGAGKTTLLRALAGLIRPQRGQITLDGADLQRLGPRQVARLVGYLPQVRSLHEDLTVAELVARGLLPMGAMSAAESRRAVREALELCGIAELRDRRLSQVSGGEGQKAWIAFAIVRRPKVLLLDEPTSHLDYRHQMEVLELVRRLCSEGVAAVVALHDLWLATRYCHRLLVLDRGRPVAVGPAESVLDTELLRGVFGVEAVAASLPSGGRAWLPAAPSGPTTVEGGDGRERLRERGARR